MARSRFVPNRRNIATFLRTPQTRALIERKTRAVEAAASAAARADGSGGQFRTDVDAGEHRVRGAVIGDYSTSDPEVSRRALLRALDAARTAE
ncbi:hypothetical protein ACIQPP_05595 [Streptomyces violaceusniger]|uniref:hypothetical protein n=1 Tax=Streptomyces violaceusniger TaxID=68280 RepID=UPI0009978DC3|nr:hypothetical protein [Streptomyces hygroscopicus]AQW55294.1 hypothetical protein SHXM_08757 [Streptomyces hygroscopicus]